MAKAKRFAQLNPTVFFVSAGVILLFVLAGIIAPAGVGAAFGAIQTFIVEQLGWFYIIAVTFFLVFVLWLLFSPHGAVKLGKDEDEPEYSTVSWFAMLFSAGMGIGLLFFSVAEPVLHYTSPPGGDQEAAAVAAAVDQTLPADGALVAPEAGAQAQARPTAEQIARAKQAMTITFFHWGLHAWAIYIIVGLALAYFAYRHDLPLTIRSTLYPLLGKRIHGPIGHTVEIVAVFGTLFGVATSLGLGVQQINAGLEYLGLLDVSLPAQLTLIGVITAAATISVVSGLDVGIRRLSELNLFFGLLLLLFVFFVGPTIFLLSSFVQSLGQYLTSLIAITFRTDAYVGTEWQASWTMFYWGWWISWSPFVGMFIARISRGRTIRSFIAGVLLVPTVVTFLWMVVFGNTALHLELFGTSNIAEAVAEAIPTALFVMLFELQWPLITSGLAVLVVATFFVTSSDSASLVIDTLTSNGSLHPPIWQRVFWAVTEGVVAGTLLVTGGLLALRTAAITTALPFCVVMLFMCWSLVRGLRAETRAPLPSLALGPDAELDAADAPDEQLAWQDQLKSIIGSKPVATEDDTSVVQAREVMGRFVEDTVLPAFRSLRKELQPLDRDAVIERHHFHAVLSVMREGTQEFRYALRTRAYRQAHVAFPEFDGPDAPRILRVEIVAGGGAHRDYPLEDFTRDGIIQDFLHEYAKWMGW